MNKTKSVSFPIFGILGLIFVTLKLAEIGTVATWGVALGAESILVAAYCNIEYRSNCIYRSFDCSCGE